MTSRTALPLEQLSFYALKRDGLFSPRPKGIEALISNKSLSLVNANILTLTLVKGCRKSHQPSLPSIASLVTAPHLSDT